jgi:molybdopterin-dependent oxidoreductase alpha subunit
MANDPSDKLPARHVGPPVKGENNIASPMPFGIGHDKPHHIIEMAEVMWENRDNLGYAWRILNQGVCDGCSLGPKGLRDDVIDGIHVCTTRLKLLRLNTQPALDPADLADMGRLRGMSNKALQDLGRLPYPMVYRPGDRGFSRLSWDEALGLIGDKMRDTPPERQGWFATSRGITNETYYTFTKAARAMGTNNVDLCARLCHASTVAGLKRTIGVGAPTCSLKDMVGTDLLLLFGTNIANNQPVTTKYLVEAKKRGTRVVVINTTLERGLERYWVPSMPVSALFGTRLMDDFVQVNAGGDIAFMSGMLKHVIALGAEDQDFIDKHTAGFDELSAKLDSLSWDELERISGTSRREMEWVGELFARAESAVTVYSMGLTQHRFGTENVESVVNLHLSRGLIGKDKCGILPIRGHSGVQGGGECGVSPTTLPGGRSVNPEDCAEMSALWGFEVPQMKGLSTVPMVKAAHAGEIDVLYNVGGNLLHTMPDPDLVSEAMGRVGMRIHQDIVVNASMLIDPGEVLILLPAQTRYEQRGGGTSTSTERRIRFSPEIPGHPQVGEARPEWEIPCQIVMQANPDLRAAFGYPDAQDIRNEMGQTMPVYKGIETLRKAGDWVQWGGPHLCADGFKNMPDERAKFTVLDPPSRLAPEGQWMLTTRRGKQFNSIIIKSKDHLQGGRDRDDLFMNPGDIANLGLRDGARVRVHNDHGEWHARLRSMPIKPGVVQAYWPECNPVIPIEMDPRSEEPDYNAAVHIESL